MELVSRIKIFIRNQRSFILYVSIGFIGLTLDLSSFIFFVRVLHIDELIANPISMSLGIVNNFFFNAYFNFKKTDNLPRRLLTFYSVGLVGIVVGDLFLWLFNDVLGGHITSILALFSSVLAQYRLELVKAASIVFIAIMQYFLNKRFSFRTLPVA